MPSQSSEEQSVNLKWWIAFKLSSIHWRLWILLVWLYRMFCLVTGSGWYPGWRAQELDCMLTSSLLTCPGVWLHRIWRAIVEMPLCEFCCIKVSREVRADQPFWAVSIASIKHSPKSHRITVFFSGCYRTSLNGYTSHLLSFTARTSYIISLYWSYIAYTLHMEGHSFNVSIPRVGLEIELCFCVCPRQMSAKTRAFVMHQFILFQKLRCARKSQTLESMESQH